MLVGALVLGTAGATAQAASLPFSTVPTAGISVTDLTGGGKTVTGSSGAAAGGGGDSDGEKRSGSGGGNGSGSGRGDDRGGDGSRGGESGGLRGGGEGGDEQPAPDAPQEPPQGPQATAEDAIELAKSQVGITEDSRGNTKFNDWYIQSPRAQETVARDGGSPRGYRGAAWCDMFVSWIGEQIGLADQFGSDAWTVEHARWFEEQGRWGTEPKPGAIVFFAWSGGKKISDIVHVGIVTRKISDSRVETVEGNTSNAVKVRQRSSGTIVGYGYPEYKA